MRLNLRRFFPRIGFSKPAWLGRQKLIVDFDETFYLEYNPDVQAAGVDPKAHYLAEGLEEGRPGNANAYVRKFFDVDFDAAEYLELHPDVAQAGFDAAWHFLKHGREEGRVTHRTVRVAQTTLPLPTPTIDSVAVTATIDAQFAHSKASRSSTSAQLHVEFSSDGRLIREPFRFDAAAYLRDNPDVAEALPHETEVLAEHWLKHGVFENRPADGLSAYSNRALTRAFWRKKPEITCYGLFDAPSGLGAAARAYRDAFIQAGFEVSTVVVRERSGRFITEPDVRKSHTQGGGDLLRLNFYVLNADMMDIFFLDDRRHLLDDSYNIAVWYWELAYFPAKWLSAFGPLDEVWVASEFCRNSISALSPIPVLLLPPPVRAPSCNSTFPRKHFAISQNAFVFGSIFDVGSTLERKNPYALVKAFRAAFGDREDVCLALKYHGAHHYPSAIRELHSLATGASNIHFFGTVMGDEEIASFRATIDCLVSPHRSEGFGFNLAESLLLKKPVVATNYSGSRDFLTTETGFPVDYKLVEVGSQLGPYPAEALWAGPDLDALALTLVSVFNNKEEAARRALNGCDYVVREYSLDACARRIRVHLDELGVFADAPRGITTWGGGRGAARQLLARSSVRFTAIVPVMDTPSELLADCLNSFFDQTHADWELVLVDVGSRSRATVSALESLRGVDARVRILSADNNSDSARQMNRAVEISSGGFLLFTRAENTIAADAIRSLVEAAEPDEQADLIYSDEDLMDSEGVRGRPNFKPDWSPEYLESSMYISELLCIRRELLLDIGGMPQSVGGAWLYDLALRASRRARRIVHIPKILCHTRPPRYITKEAEVTALSAGQHALVDHLHAAGRNVTVERGLIPGTFRVRDAIPSGLPVTLLIFTNNGSANIINRGQINLFNHFFDSIISKTETICDLKILVADNGNLSDDQRLRVEGVGGKVIGYSGSTSPFNFPKKANFALAHVETEYVILLNDDMEVIEPGWVDALIEIAIRPTTGVVGAKLLFPDNSIQHCGVILGVFEDAAHIFHGTPENIVGYNGVTHLIRNYSAVTGACMATRMSIVRELGGFDDALAIDYNDLDFCLRAQEIGYRNVFTPFAQLYHFEGKTATRSVSTQTDQVLFRERWSSLIASDPQYNPNFSRSSVTFGWAD